MQFQTKITGIEKRLIAKGIEDYPSEKAFLILSRTETENKASTNTAVIRMVGIRNLFSANL
jgi:hypothetical protein